MRVNTNTPVIIDAKRIKGRGMLKSIIKQRAIVEMPNGVFVSVDETREMRIDHSAEVPSKK